MATQGFDSTFGLRGTCATEVAGFGGWPLGVVVGKDGRPTIVCRATAQKKVDHDDVGSGSRFKKRRFSTVRIVSFPPNGKPKANVSPTLQPDSTTAFNPDPTVDFNATKAIVRPDRIAVLGTKSNGTGIPTLQVYEAGTISNGVAPWSLAREIKLTGLTGEVDRWGLGWDDGFVVVAAPRVATRVVRLGGGPANQLDIFTERDGQFTPADFFVPTTFNFPTGFTVNVLAGGVYLPQPDTLYVGLTWEGTDLTINPRLASFTAQARASVGALIRAPVTWGFDPNFGDQGLWIATAQDGEVTTSEHLVSVSNNRLAISGRAKRGGTTSIFVAGLDRSAGELDWNSYPGSGTAIRASGMTSESGQLLVCGDTFDARAGNNPSEAVVVSLSAAGQPTAGFGANGVAQFRLHGGTRVAAITATASGGVPLVASAVPWGRLASAGSSFQPCVSRLSANGNLDVTFGSPGMCRHDGLGSAELVAIGPTGRIWAAGVAKVFVYPNFVNTLVVSQLNPNGELETGFGVNGTATFQFTQWDILNVQTLVPLADGRAIVGGGATLHGSGPPPTGGSWFVRLLSNGLIDSTFGVARRRVPPNGTQFYSGRDIQIVAELGDGSLQGVVPDLGGVGPMLRFGSEGNPDIAYGANGIMTVAKPIVTNPMTFEPSGGFFAPVLGKVDEIGLIHCLANGTVDPNFGAGGGPSTTTLGNPDSRFVYIPGVALNGSVGLAEFRHQTHRLANGSFLTLWTIQRQETVTVRLGTGTTKVNHDTNSLLVLAWNASGIPIIQKHIPNRAALQLNWIGWSHQYSVLQPDGSILIALSGDDVDVSPGLLEDAPPRVSQVPYFCRLMPPNFGLDPNFGSGGFVVQRAPGCEFVVPQTTPLQIPANSAESQWPLTMQRLANDQVIAAIRCKHWLDINNEIDVPNLPLDGSVGAARLT